MDSFLKTALPADGMTSSGGAAPFGDIFLETSRQREPNTSSGLAGSLSEKKEPTPQKNHSHRRVKSRCFGSVFAFLSGIITVAAGAFAAWTGGLVFWIFAPGLICSGAGRVIYTGASLAGLITDARRKGSWRNEWKSFFHFIAQKIFLELPETGVQIKGKLWDVGRQNHEHQRDIEICNLMGGVLACCGGVTAVIAAVATGGIPFLVTASAMTFFGVGGVASSAPLLDHLRIKGSVADGVAEMCNFAEMKILHGLISSNAEVGKNATRLHKNYKDIKRVKLFGSALGVVGGIVTVAAGAVQVWNGGMTANLFGAGMIVFASAGVFMHGASFVAWILLRRMKQSFRRDWRDCFYRIEDKKARQEAETREMANCENARREMEIQEAETREMEERENARREIERQEAETREMARRENVRLEMERQIAETREMARRENARLEMERQEAETREMEKRENARREMERQEAETREMGRRENARLEMERQEAETREMARRENARLQMERQEAETREMEKRENARREMERQQTETREMERQEAEKREMAKRENEKTQNERLGKLSKRAKKVSSSLRKVCRQLDEYQPEITLAKAVGTGVDFLGRATAGLAKMAPGWTGAVVSSVGDLVSKGGKGLKNYDNETAIEIKVLQDLQDEWDEFKKLFDQEQKALKNNSTMYPADIGRDVKTLFKKLGSKLRRINEAAELEKVALSSVDKISLDFINLVNTAVKSDKKSEITSYLKDLADHLEELSDRLSTSVD